MDSKLAKLRSAMDCFAAKLREIELSESTVSLYVRTVKAALSHFAEKGMDRFDLQEGIRFVEGNFAKSMWDLRKSAMRRFENFVAELPLERRGRDPLKCDPDFSVAFNSYIDHCASIGNSEGTLRRKRAAVTRFLGAIKGQGVRSTCLITHKEMLAALPVVSGVEGRAAVKEFLRYCFDEGLVPSAAFAAIRVARRKKPLPVVYSKDEIEAAYQKIDCLKTNRERFRCVYLLACELGIRPRDIFGLRVGDVDLIGMRVSFVQAKTGRPLSLPLSNRLASAIRSYLEGERPATGLDFLFISDGRPRGKLSNGSVFPTLRKVFDLAGIDRRGRKLGLSVMRSSLASNLVNSDVPYEVVRDVLGHSSKRAIEHYVSIDVERLREYALEPIPLSGKILHALEGK